MCLGAGFECVVFTHSAQYMVSLISEPITNQAYRQSVDKDIKIIWGVRHTTTPSRTSGYGNSKSRQQPESGFSFWSEGRFATWGLILRFRGSLEGSPTDPKICKIWPSDTNHGAPRVFEDTPDFLTDSAFPTSFQSFWQRDLRIHNRQPISELGHARRRAPTQ